MIWLVLLFVAASVTTASEDDRMPILRAGSVRVDLSLRSGLIFLSAPGLDWVPFELPRPTNRTPVDYRIVDQKPLSATVDVHDGDQLCGSIQISAVTASAVRISSVLKCGSGVVVRWRPKPSEDLFGIFEDRGDLSLNLRGITAPLFSTTAPLSTQAANARAPFLFSQRGYAIYVESEANGTFFVQTDSGSGFSYPENELSFLVFFGTSPSEVMKQYSWFSGPIAIPPDWALGPIWWRDDAGGLLRGRKNAQQNIIEDLDYFLDHHIPISAFLIDRPFGRGELGWGNFDFDPRRFPDFGKLVHRLRRDHIALMVWVANRAAGEMYSSASKKGWLFPGNETAWPAMDLRIEEAAEWLEGRLSKFAHLGVQGFKIDRGDEGEHPDEVGNRLSILMGEVASRALTPRGSTPPVLMARSAFDRARSTVVLWSGDPKSTFDGLRRSIVHGLRAALIGFPLWGSDTGGYSGRPGEELFLRWVQFSTFSPILEILMDHGTTLYPYDLSSKGLDILRHFLQLREAMRPALKRAILRYRETGIPLMRPVFFDYVDDPESFGVTDQYLFGAQLMIAPIVDPGTFRRVYLPPGEWIRVQSADCSDGDRYVGPTTVDVTAELTEMPIFRRNRGERGSGCRGLFEVAL